MDCYKYSWKVLSVLLGLCLLGSVASAGVRIHGSWEKVFEDTFDGTSVPYNGDPNLDQGLTANWWFQGGVDTGEYLRRDGSGYLEIGSTNVVFLVSKNKFPFSKPTEICVEGLNQGNPAGLSFYLWQRWLYLDDQSGQNIIEVHFRASDRMFAVKYQENGGPMKDYFYAACNAYAPSISIVLTDKTIDVYTDRSRVDLEDPEAAHRDLKGLSIKHNMPASVINDGFHIVLCGSRFVSEPVTEVRFAGVTVARPYEATATVGVNVTSTVIKSGLDPNVQSSVNWEQSMTEGSTREIFDNSVFYSDFIDFLHNEVRFKNFRYPGGSVDSFFPGYTYRQWLPAKAKLDSSYIPYLTNPTNFWIEVEEFFQFLEVGDFTTILQLNTQTWYDSDSNTIVNLLTTNWSNGRSDEVNEVDLAHATAAVGNLAQWIVDNQYTDRVALFELGNEDYGADANSYAKVAASFMQEVHSVIPNAKFIISSGAGDDNDGTQDKDIWTADVINELERLGSMNLVHGFAPHLYWASSGMDPSTNTGGTAYQEYAADIATSVQSRIDQFRQTPIQEGYGNLPLYFTEFKLGGMLEGHVKALAGGLGNLRFMAGMLASPNVGSASLFNLLHGSHVALSANRGYENWGYNTIDYCAEPDPNFYPRFANTPLSEGWNIIEKLANGDVLASTSNKSRIMSVATTDGNTLRVLVFNGYAQPEDEFDAVPNFWGSWATEYINSLVADSASADRFLMTMNLPSGFDPAPAGTVSTLGTPDVDTLDTRSTSYFSVYQLKIQSKPFNVNTVDGSIEYELAPHTAYLFEIPVKSCGDTGYLEADANTDCQVDMEDLAVLVEAWLTCNNPREAGCVNNW